MQGFPLSPALPSPFLAGRIGVNTPCRQFHGSAATDKLNPNQLSTMTSAFGYQPKDSRRVYVRYAALNNDWAPTANAASWNVQQFTLGVVQPIRKGVWAEFQWEKNMESPPAGTVQTNNDLLFVEFFTGF